MRLEEKYIKFGYFWLPENQQNSIAGFSPFMMVDGQN